MILDHEENFHDSNIKLKILDVKIDKTKAQLARIGVNIKGEIYRTIDMFWVPKFMIDKNKYISTTNWEKSHEILREIKDKILEKEKEAFTVVDELKEKNQSKQCIVERHDGRRATVWIYWLNVERRRISGYHVNRTINSGYGEWEDNKKKKKDEQKAIEDAIKDADVTGWFK